MNLTHQHKNGIKPPVVMASVILSGDINSKAEIACTPVLISAVSEWMMGEEEISRNENIGSDELDAAKEIFSNLFSAFSTSLGAQKGMPKISFEVINVNFLDENSLLDFSVYEKLFLFNVKIEDLNEHIAFVCDRTLMRFFEPAASNDSLEDLKAAATPHASKGEFSAEEMRNIGLIMDVRLPMRVRIGSKRMLLKDVLTMDIGSVIELNQLANDPLEILIGDKGDRTWRSGHNRRKLRHSDHTNRLKTREASAVKIMNNELINDLLKFPSVLDYKNKKCHLLWLG